MRSVVSDPSLAGSGVEAEAIVRHISITFDELEKRLERIPIVCDLHPLTPAALQPQVQICTQGKEFLRLVDDQHARIEGKVCILRDDCPQLEDRLPTYHVAGLPTADAFNQNMAHHLDYIRTNLLTSHQVSTYIAGKVAILRPDIVTLILIDGLSYQDTLDWQLGEVWPCFIDGPSVTYKFLTADETRLNPEIGFAALVGNPSLWSRLQKHGYQFAQGYTYWTPGSNKVADYLFSGVPYQRTTNFDEIVRRIDSAEISAGTYLQIAREGLDGLAHSKRELQRVEIDGAITAIRQDIERIAEVLRLKGRSFVVFAVADHGILWKSETDWRKLPSRGNTHSRYSLAPAVSIASDHFVEIKRGGDTYQLCRYPYLLGTIPADDSGVHGGLSFQESFVPLLTLQG